MLATQAKALKKDHRQQLCKTQAQAWLSTDSRNSGVGRVGIWICLWLGPKSLLNPVSSRFCETMSQNIFYKATDSKIKWSLPPSIYRHIYIQSASRTQKGKQYINIHHIATHTVKKKILSFWDCAETHITTYSYSVSNVWLIKALPSKEERELTAFIIAIKWALRVKAYVWR